MFEDKIITGRLKPNFGLKNDFRSCKTEHSLALEFQKVIF